MFHIIFLVVLALIWMFFAVAQDIKKREIANWLNFSLIIFAFGFRFFYSLFQEDNFQFFYNGLIGFAIFLALGLILYYGRFFAAGDAKLMFALGAILPFSNVFLINLKIYISFFILFIFSSAIYGLFSMFFLIFTNFHNFKKDFIKQLKLSKNMLVVYLFLALFLFILGFSEKVLFYFSILAFILPYLYLISISVDKVCMIKKVSPKNLKEGDLLYQNVKIGKKIIKKHWEGLNSKDIRLLKGKKFVLIRQGVPFSPVFLISFLVLIYLWFFI